MPPSSTSSSLKMPVEPDLSQKVESGTDRLVLRNIIYTAWSIFNSGGGGIAYTKWNVERIADGRGYLLLIEFGQGFRIGLHEMQLLHDVCPLRIDSVFVRDNSENGGGMLCISLLDSEQPVHLTESDVVRVQKRSRGILLSDDLTTVLKRFSGGSGGGGVGGGK